MIPNNLPDIDDIEKFSKCWSPMGFLGAEINGIMYEDPVATEIIKHYAHIGATDIVKQYKGYGK